MPRTKAYKIGKKVVPGTTTVTNEETGWNKGALIWWGNKIGLGDPEKDVPGVKVNEYLDPLQKIGTGAHEMAISMIGGPKFDPDKYSKNELDKIENCCISFLEWLKGHEVKLVLSEERFICDTYEFGGTIDIYGVVDGEMELIDIKTGKAIYDESIMQVVAYKHLLQTNGRSVDRVRVLNIPRDESEKWGEHIVTREQERIYWEIFKNCLENRRLHKEVSKSG